MNKLSAKSARLLLLLLLASPQAALHSQAKTQADFAIVEGGVFGAKNIPLGNADVLLESENHAQKFTAQSDSRGHFRFDSVPPGSYTLRASKQGFAPQTFPLFPLHSAEVKTLALHLEKSDPSAAVADTLADVPFTDEPRFTVAGVTDASNLGGHGSDTALRTKESLARDAAALSGKSANASANKASPSEASAQLHANLGDAAEKEGRPLEAVREYQLAAELNSSEPNLFAWGAELLLHRAFEPAIEVFSKGSRLYPKSARLLVGLGVATYSQGATEKGQQLLLQACDLDPMDPTPYLFLGKLQEAEKIPLPGWTEKLARFVRLHPENAEAHYDYAVALGKNSDSQTADKFAMREKELNEAISRDPKFGDAYLQLGILYSEKKDVSAAVAALKKAIEFSPLPDEAHFRLAQLYRQQGETEKARKETALYLKTTLERTKLAEKQRHDLQQFVYTLRSQP